MNTWPLGDGATELAYWAALVDGEGSIMFLKQIQRGRSIRPVYYAVLRVSNTYRQVIEEAKDYFGAGHIVTSGGENGRKLVYNWVVKSREASEVIAKILPFLRIKKKQAEIVLEAQRHITNFDQFVRGKRNPDGSYRHVPEDELTYKEQARITVGRLNQRGSSQPRYT